MQPVGEPSIDVGFVEPVTVQQGRGEQQRHLGVVGPLAGPPAEPAPAAHLRGQPAGRTEETGGERAGRAELEGCAERVADDGADEGSDDSLPSVGGLQFGVGHRWGSSSRGCGWAMSVGTGRADRLADAV